MSLKSSISRIRDPLEGPNTMGNSTLFWTMFVLGVAALVVYPMVATSFATQNLALFMTYAFLGVSLCFIWGYCGILSFGQVAFFGVAGYTFGIIAINIQSLTGVTLAIFGAIAVATAFAAALGYFMFYGGVRDVYVTILTLVVALVLYTFMGQTAGSEWAIGEARLGGFNGMVGIPDLGLGVGNTGLILTGDAYYYTVLGLLLVTYLGLRLLVNSQFGYAMVATREDEDRTAMFGYNTQFIKLAVFTFGGTLAGLGGVLFVTWGNYIDPSEFAITAAALPVIWASVGGRESILGTIVAAIAIQAFSQALAVTGSEWALVTVGALLLITILVMPDGVAPQVEKGVGRLSKRINERRSPAGSSEEVAD